MNTVKWYCSSCDKTIKIKSKPKHINSTSHKRIQKCGVVVEEYEFDNPDINLIFFINDKCAKICHDKSFHKFTFEFIYDNEMTNDDCVIGTISDKKVKNIVRENGFSRELSINSDSIRSNVNKHSHSKFRKHIFNRHFCRRISQDHEYVKTHCNDKKNLFHFSIRKWYLDNRSR